MFKWFKKFFKRFFGLDYGDVAVGPKPVRPPIDDKGEILLGRGNDGPSHGGGGRPEGKGEVSVKTNADRPHKADENLKGNDENLFKNKKKKVLLGRGNDGPSRGGGGRPEGKGEISVKTNADRPHKADEKLKGNDDNLFKNKKKK